MLEAEKVSQVAKIQYDQKIMEKESMRKMSEIEGMSWWRKIYMILCWWQSIILLTLNFCFQQVHLMFVFAKVLLF